MNERLKEILKQSGLQPYYNAQEEDIKKFAELIVEECARAAEEHWNDAGLQRAFSPSEYVYTILGVAE